MCTARCATSSLVFVYMLARQAVSADVANIDEVRTVLLACLYVTYAYIGSEISYPLKVYYKTASTLLATVRRMA